MEDILSDVPEDTVEVPRVPLFNHSEIVQNDVAVHLSKYPKPAG